MKTTSGGAKRFSVFHAQGEMLWDEFDGIALSDGNQSFITENMR